MFTMKIKRYLTVESLSVILIVIIGFYLRMCHANQGLQYIYNHDGQNFIEQALRYGKGTLKPIGLFHGPFLSYVLFFEYASYFIVNLIMGKMANPIDLIKAYILDPSPFFMLAGIAIVFFSVGILLLTYHICKKYFNEKTGLVAAYFASVSFYLVYLSHCIKGDMVVGFFILCAFYFAIKALNKSQHFLKSLYISAIFTGIAISVKYYGFIGFFLIIAVLAVKIKDRGISLSSFLKVFLKCGLITSGIFFILNPYVLIGLQGFLKELVGMKSVYSASFDPSHRPTWLLYLLFLKEGAGAPIFYLYLVSLLFVFKNKNIFLCNVYPVSLYIFLSSFRAGMPYFLPSAIPFMLISSAFLMVKVVEFLIKNRNAQSMVIFFVAILFSLSTFIVSLKFCSLLDGTEDTRTLAKKWMESNIKENSSILIDGSYSLNIVYSAPLRENIDTLRRGVDEIKKAGGSGFLWECKMKYASFQKTPAYDIYKVRFMSIEDIEKYKAEYVVLSSYDLPSICSEISPEKDYLKGKYACIKKILPDSSIRFFPSFESLYHGAFEGIDKISFKSLSMFRSYGPVIEIYEKIE